METNKIYNGFPFKTGGLSQISYWSVVLMASSDEALKASEARPVTQILAHPEVCKAYNYFLYYLTDLLIPLRS